MFLCAFTRILEGKWYKLGMVEYEINGGPTVVKAIFWLSIELNN